MYQASDFNAPITITNLEFFNTQFNGGSSNLPTGNWVVSLSTTSAGVGTLSGNFAANTGPDNTQVFSGNITQSWAFGDTLHITLSTPFNYNPANGNLLMDVVGSGITLNGPATFFDVHSPGLLFQRVYCPFGNACSTGTVDVPGFGLVTGFSTGTTVPEPGSLMLLGSGLIGVVGIMRRKLML